MSSNYVHGVQFSPGIRAIQNSYYKIKRVEKALMLAVP